MNNDSAKTNKRRTYFIEKGFQSRFILKFCMLVLGAGLITIGILYLLASQSTTVSIVDSRVVVRTTADFLLPILIQTVVIVTIIASLATIVLALFASHKIVGPLYRFKKAMQAMEEGDFSSDFHIRHLDQLQDLSGAFNSMIKKLRQEQNKIKVNFVSLQQKLDSIPDQEIPEQKRTTFSELKKISQELNKLIDYFKT